MHHRSLSIAVALLWGLAAAVSASPALEINVLQDAAEARIGVMTGSLGETVARGRFPAADVQSFDDIMDAVAAIKAGHLDAIVTTFPTAYQVVKKTTGLKVLPEQLDQEETSVALRKGNLELLASINRIIAALGADGTLADMRSRWIKPDNTPYREVEIPVPTSGTPLRVGVAATREPLSFTQGGRVTGHDGELARRLAAGLQRPIEFVDMKFMALIPALISGKIDLIVTGMTATPERAKTVDFSASYFSNAQVLLASATAAAATPAAPAASTPMLHGTADLDGKRIAVMLGSVYDTFAQKNYPQATVLQFETSADQQLAVLAGKADAGFADEEGLVEVFGKNPQLEMFGEPLLELPMGVGFRKGNTELRDAFNRFLAGIRENGVYDDMVARWITRHETQMPVIAAANPTGPLVAGVSAGGLPFAAVKDGELVGFDIEMLTRFAASLGKDLSFAQMPFGGLIAANASGKVDLIAASMFITEERQQRIDFSDPYYSTAGRAFALGARLAKAPASAPAAAGAPLLASLDDLKDKRLGVQLGTVFDIYATKTFPQATVLQFPTFQEVILALIAGKVDAGFIDVDTIVEVMRSQTELATFGETLFSSPVAAGFNKRNPQLRLDFDAFLKDIRANGVYDDMVERWMRQGVQQMPELPAYAANGSLVVGMSTPGFPFIAVQNGELAGFDIELAKRFGAHIGKEPVFANQEFSGLIAALISGKVDVIITGMYKTDERAKQIDFSEPYFEQDNVAFALRANTLPRAAPVVSAPDAAAVPVELSFIDKAVEGFESNIMREQRYLLLWDGLKSTVIISILATLFGTALGAVVCFMRMSPLALLRLPARCYISVLRGMPVVVLLMLIFYVVFASVNIDPVFVAVIAFGMNFAAYVSEMFRSGIEGVDRGQSEAGIAMGFSRTQTFIHIVLPQMLQRILPVYKGEFISLVKMTSIVGYIAVQDLTKASDIIRSRTFDAFFPLVMVAVLYFVISWVLMQALEYLERVTDPRSGRRSA